MKSEHGNGASGGATGLVVLLAVITMAVLAALFAIFVHAPVERTMGVAQRIFYFHVPCAITMEYWFFACGICSAVYLVKRDERWDSLAVSFGEVGMLFFVCVMGSGPFWARKAWGVWWTWDPRLTSTLLAGLIFLGYVILRGASHAGEPEKRFAAGLAIFGALDIPIIRFSVERWRGTHPQVITGRGGGIHPDMRPALILGMLTILLLGVALVWIRWRPQRIIQRLESMEAEVARRGLLD